MKPWTRRAGRRLALLAAAALLAGCAGINAYRDPPRVSLLAIEPLEVGVLEQRYAMKLRILNPNAKPLPIRGLDYSIEINRREFAYGVSRQSVTLPGYGEAVLEVEVVSNLLGVLRQLQSATQQEPAGLEYRLSGRIDVAGSPLRLPFDRRGELDWLPGGGAPARR